MGCKDHKSQSTKRLLGKNYQLNMTGLPNWGLSMALIFCTRPNQATSQHGWTNYSQGPRMRSTGSQLLLGEGNSVLMEDVTTGGESLIQQSALQCAGQHQLRLTYLRQKRGRWYKFEKKIGWEPGGTWVVRVRFDQNALCGILQELYWKRIDTKLIMVNDVTLDKGRKKFLTKSHM